MGYGTMDLLAAFFFCSVAYKNVVNKCQMAGATSQKMVVRIMLISCLIGAALISLVYTGFVYAAASHAEALRFIPTEGLIGAIAHITLGQYGTVFMGACVAVACLATGTTLAEVTTEYLFHNVFRGKLPRMVCLLMVMVMMAFMSILGFGGIMKIAGPILNVVYPAVIVFCIVNIILKLMSRKVSFKPVLVSNLGKKPVAELE